MAVNTAGKEWENEENGNDLRQFDFCAGRRAGGPCRNRCAEKQVTSAGDEAHGQTDKQYTEILRIYGKGVGGTEKGNRKARVGGG